VFRLYLNYTRQQEMLTRSFRALQREVAASYPEARPAWLAEAYRAMNKPLLKYYNILTATPGCCLAVAVCTKRAAPLSGVRDRVPERAARLGLVGPESDQRAAAG
jgi:hypothetical protein